MRSNYIKDIFTARNGIDWSLCKLLSVIGGGTMIYKFGVSLTPDFLGFASGLSLIVASLAGKYYVESHTEVEDATEKPLG